MVQRLTVSRTGIALPDLLAQARLLVASSRECEWPGHLGNERRTVQNLEIVEVDTERNVLLVKGGVPGRETASSWFAER